MTAPDPYISVRVSDDALNVDDLEVSKTGDPRGQVEHCGAGNHKSEDPVSRTT